MEIKNNECEKHLNKNLLEKFLQSSEQYVERDICEYKRAFREKLGREPTEKEIEEWLLS